MKGTGKTIVGELISQEISSIFSENDYQLMFNHINNRVHETPDTFDTSLSYNIGERVIYANQVWNCKYVISEPGEWTGDGNWELDTNYDTREIVDTSVIDNNGYSGKIWPIGENKIVPEDEELVSEDTGWAYIRGQTYKVSDDDTELIPTVGSQRYGISDLPTHKYVSKNLIGVIIQVDQTTWEFKYLKTNRMDVIETTTNIQEAYQFKGNKVLQTDETAYEWIERAVGNPYNHSRSDFTVIPYLQLQTNEDTHEVEYDTKKVASSNKVILDNTDEKYVSSVPTPGKFCVRHIGEGDDRFVFLTYEKSLDENNQALPSRFEIKDERPFDLPTTSLVNLDIYERSIRG